MTILRLIPAAFNTLDHDVSTKAATANRTLSTPNNKKSILKLVACSGLGYASSAKSKIQRHKFGADVAAKACPAAHGISVTLIAGQANTISRFGLSQTASAKLGEIRGVAVQGDGTIWVCDDQQHAIHRITPAGAVTTPYSAEHIAQFTDLDALCIDESTGAALLTVGQAGQGQLQSMSLATLSTPTSQGVPPTSMQALNGDGPVATHSIIPTCLAAGKLEAGKPVLWVGELNRLRKITNGEITTVLANSGVVTSIVVDAQGDVFALIHISLLASKIVKVSGNTVSLVAGGLPASTTTTDTADVDGSGASAVFTCAAGLAIDKTTGNMYLCSHGGLRQITPEGVVTTLVPFLNLQDAYPANSFAPIDFMVCTAPKCFIVASQSMVHSITLE